MKKKQIFGIVAIFLTLSACISKQTIQNDICKSDGINGRNPSNVKCDGIFRNDFESKNKENIKDKNVIESKIEMDSRNKYYHDNKLDLQNLEPGNFFTWINAEKSEIKITKKFSIMNKPLTVDQATIIEHVLGVLLEERASGYPESVFDANSFIDRLKNENHNGLIIMTDYNDAHNICVNLNKASSSSGPKIQALLAELIPGYKKGNKFSIPTEAQWTYGIQQIKPSSDIVNEWNSDWYTDDKNGRSGSDPKGPSRPDENTGIHSEFAHVVQNVKTRDNNGKVVYNRDHGTVGTNINELHGSRAAVRLVMEEPRWWHAFVPGK